MLGPILVLEDDRDLLALICRLLEADGHRVVGAPTPREALERARAERPALVVTDLMLPEMDGEAFVRALRSELRDAPPVVIVSASAARVPLAKKLEAAGSLPKPFEPDDLRELVGKLVSRPSALP